jgi:3',5'-cyclic AMP phosphodiesterase CpdA
MRVIAHLSDLHFGRTDQQMIAEVQKTLVDLAPDIIAVSGDLTQRAKVNEFMEAREFLRHLPAPYLAVPGNHDIPLYDPYRRFGQPLTRYKQYISETVEPSYSDSELTIVSLNTARSLTFKGGRISAEQADRACKQLASATPSAVKVLIAHHPIDLPHGSLHPVAGRARMALGKLANFGLDMILTGHLHTWYFPEPAERLTIGGHAALLIQAGTVSTRARGEVSSFNSIVTDKDQIELTQHCWSPERNRFDACRKARYERRDSRWIRQDL